MTDKELFFEHMSKILSSFTKDENLNIWTLEREIEQPGATIIINGQRIQQPSQKQKIKVVIDATGEGYWGISGSVDYCEICQLSISVELNGRKKCYPDECIPYSDLEYLDNYLNSVL